MRADHLARRVALDAFGAGIPGGDDAVRIEHVERIVGDAAHQQAELPFTLAQRLLRLAPLGDVARDLGEAEERPVVAADRVYRHRGEEAGAVLAHTPAFGLALSAARRRLERARRHAGGAVLGGVEAADMAADDLLVAVALDALGADVPVHHDAAGIEHEDRVVADTLHQQAKPLLAVEQRLLHGAPLREVAGDLGEPDEGAVFVVHDVEDRVRPEAAAVLAHAPALALEAALAPRDGERMLGQAGAPILVREEAGEMRADDL